MRHFAEFIVFNGFNSVSFRTAANAAVARADDKPGPRRRRFLKNNTARQRLWQEIVGLLSRAPARLASRFGRIADLAILARLRPTSAHLSRCWCSTSFPQPVIRKNEFPATHRTQPASAAIFEASEWSPRTSAKQKSGRSSLRINRGQRSMDCPSLRRSSRPQRRRDDGSSNRQDYQAGRPDHDANDRTPTCRLSR